MLFTVYTGMARLLRKLLRMNLPVPVRTDAEIEAEVQRNYRWNFGVNLADGTFFWLGISFVSSSTIIPLFVSKLSTNPLLIGLVAVIAQAGWFLPQLLTAGYIERTARKKPWVINLGFFTERLPVLLWPLAALMVPFAPGWALALFFLTYALHGIGAGLIAPAWQDMIAACFPVSRRGRFMGMTMFVGTAAGALGAFLSSWILETYAFPRNFLYLFLLAALFITLSWLALALTREPVRAVPTANQSSRDFRAKLVRILQRDHNFRRFLTARLLLALGNMGFGFVTVSAVYRWNAPDSMVGLFTAAYLLGQTAGNLALGLLADHTGHKFSLELGGAAAVLAFVLAWLAPAPTWYYAVFALLGIFTGAVIVPGLLIVMEFAQPAHRPSYIGIANTSTGVMNMVAPLIGGWIAAYSSYTWLFALSAALGALGILLMRLTVQDPRRHSFDLTQELVAHRAGD